MSPNTAAALTALLALGCQDPADRCELTDSCPKPDLAVPDLAPAQPKCAAAKGLTGDALICVDFNDFKDQILTAPISDLPGWQVDGTNRWEINGGKLQVKSFGTFVGTCSFTMPLTDLAAAANQKYQSVTLAVVQRVDLNDKLAQLQTQQIMLGLDDPARRIEFRTGSNPRQQNVNSVNRGDLTAVSGTSFQPLFKVTSSLASGATATGVQIESIAVMGNP